MLYERWLDVANAHSNEIALRDLTLDREWSFRQLDAESASPPRTAPFVYPQGNSPEFVFETLRAWRHGVPLCPLEPGQTPRTVPPLPAGCAHLKTTSATTGEPRGIAFKPEQLAADADQIVATMGLRPEWPNLGLVSMAHSYGFSNLVLPLLLHGIPLCLVEAPFPEALRQAAERHVAVTVAGVPALWKIWNDARAIPGNVKLAISAGAPLSLALESSIYSGFGLKVHNFYGSSECGGIAYDATTTPRTEENMVGSLMNGVAVEPAENGCLVVRSAAVGETYWPEPSEFLRPGRFQTTDLAEIQGGEIRLNGRLSEQINVAGRKVAPATIERALLSHPSVKECLVFGLTEAQQERAEKIVACVAGEGRASATELRQHLLALLPAWQIPHDFWFVDALSANSRGKISRAEWRRRYLERDV